MEYETEVRGFTVGVDKSGGGTLGKAYRGDWFVTIPGIYDDDKFTSEIPLTHAQVASMVAGFAEEEMED
jgi:hypothetical protein